MNPSALLLAVVSMLSQDPYSLPGAYFWGEREIVVSGVSGDVGAKLYYPAASQGANADIAAGSGPFPAIAFAHGFFVIPENYDSTLRHLATHGYIVVATRSQQLTFDPNREQYVADFLDSISYLIDQNGAAGSFLEGQVDVAAIGASGHSLGGGVSILAAARDPRIRAVGNLSASALRDSGPIAPPPPPPYADDEVGDVRVPISLINGSLDAITPVSTNGQLLYDAANAPKLLPNIVGGYHVGFTDFPFPPPFGDIGQPGALPQEDNLALGRAELTVFFDLYLKQDQSVWRRNWGPERLSYPGVETQLDPGFELLAGPATFLNSSEVRYELTVFNNSHAPDRYAFFAEDNLWDVQFDVLESPELAPGEFFTFHATVFLPSSPDALTDSVLFSARSERDGGTRAFVLATTAIPEAGSFLTLAAGCAVAGLARLRPFGLRRRDGAAV
jgi:dienelactone hydrolase